MLGTPPSYTQITESFSVNLLARPYTIFLVIGDTYNAAAVYDGNCTKTRISGGRKIGQLKRVTEDFAERRKRNFAKEIIN